MNKDNKEIVKRSSVESKQQQSREFASSERKSKFEDHSISWGLGSRGMDGFRIRLRRGVAWMALQVQALSHLSLFCHLSPPQGCAYLTGRQLCLWVRTSLPWTGKCLSILFLSFFSLHSDAAVTAHSSAVLPGFLQLE
jgi:hypothetical protein